MRTLRRLFLILALSSQLSALSLSCSATELTDLGENLSYLRVEAIDDSTKGLTAALRERDALVLDLRHVATNTDSAQLLLTSLKTRELKQPVFILIGPGTPAALAALLTASTSKFITLGIKESVPLPRVIIDQSADSDRLAYEAVDAGESITTLISGQIGKERFDEAALMKEFNNGNINAAPPAPTDPTTRSSVPEPSKAPAAKIESTLAAKPVGPTAVPLVKGAEKIPAERLTDRVLQRAIHLHRALAAIKPR